MTLEMPDDYRGETRAGSDYVKTKPRVWTEREVNWVVEAKESGFSNAEIAEATGRSEVSIFVKLKRLSKSNNAYNDKHRELKYAANQTFLDCVQPRSVLDAYAGDSWWAKNVANVTTNDLNETLDTDFHLDAFDLLCDSYRAAEKFDVIDLDPFGSAYECFDFAVRLARKGVVVSFGEWGHKRWKRTDFVGPRYNINSLDEFVPERFVQEFQRIARLHKKTATVFDSLQYANFLRVYFVLEKRKETSQWE